MGPEQENREGGTVESHPPDAHWLAMAVSPGIIASDCPAYPTLAYILYSYCDSEELCIAPIPTPGKDTHHCQIGTYGRNSSARTGLWAGLSE